MQYREIGKISKKAGVIGLGCEHLDGKPYEEVKETIDAAIEQDINIFDVFMPGKDVRENIAKALGTKRKEIMIQGHIGSTDVGVQYDISRDLPTVKKYFEDMLRIFGGYIDFGMMFFIDSEKDYKAVFETDFADYVLRLKKEGYIGHIGFSSHNPETAIKAINTGLPEMLMFSINPAFDSLAPDEYILDRFNDLNSESLLGIQPKRAELYNLCAQKQIGITVMKTLGAGKLLSKEHTPFSKPLSVHQCIHYALSRPAVSSALIGCRTRTEVLDAVRYFDIEDSEKDYSEVLSGMRNNFKGNCVYCGHCQPCPMGIDVASVNKYLDIASLNTANIPSSVRSHYKSLSHGGNECINCGSCENRCPFGVPVIENMKKAVKLFD